MIFFVTFAAMDANFMAERFLGVLFGNVLL